MLFNVQRRGSLRGRGCELRSFGLEVREEFAGGAVRGAKGELEVEAQPGCRGAL